MGSAGSNRILHISQTDHRVGRRANRSDLRLLGDLFSRIFLSGGDRHRPTTIAVPVCTQDRHMSVVKTKVVRPDREREVDYFLLSLIHTVRCVYLYFRKLCLVDALIETAAVRWHLIGR